MNLLFAPKVPASTALVIEGRRVEIAVKVSARARYYRLSLPASGQPLLTLPRHGRWAEAEKFLKRHAGWLAGRLKRAAPATPFADGETIPVHGVPHRIVATGKVRGRVEPTSIEGEPVLLVPGAPEHRSRRLTEWLKAEALAELTRRSEVHARTLGVAIKAIGVRDQASRWGSCSSTGRLNYNWRLVLAPPHVLDYVAAHEVAHLVEMNHSPAFWKTVERALPDMARGRAWLKAHGRELHGFGG
jgi:predicted metal-dependent hydrolase